MLIGKRVIMKTCTSFVHTVLLNFITIYSILEEIPEIQPFIGHWDEWQPFSTSAKHSCGKVGSILCNYMAILYNMHFALLLLIIKYGST